MIKFLVTFDYELPLGSAKSYKKALFEPADKIIELGNELNIPFIFFSDVFSAIKFKDWDYKGYYIPFVDQMKKAIQLNHDVQLHIHPHWITSNYINDSYVPSTDFSLGNFVSHEKSYTIEQIVNEGVEFLNDICKQNSNDYRCVAYRAGGYNISEAYDHIIAALISNNIVIDSSIIPGFFHKSDISTINFKKTKFNTWFISPTNGLFSPTEDGLLEIPITSKPVNGLYILARRINKIINKKEINKRTYRNTGKGFPQHKAPSTFNEKIRGLFNPVRLSFDNSHTTLKQLEKIVSYNVKKYKNTSPVYITTISHPKSMGNYHIGLLRNFILLMKEKYNDQIDFTTYQKIVND